MDDVEKKKISPSRWSQGEWPNDSLEHVVRAKSQYDSTCRGMAAEILSLRAEIDLLRSGVPDAFCIVQEDGTCIAPRCMHTPGFEDEERRLGILNALGAMDAVLAMRFVPNPFPTMKPTEVKQMRDDMHSGAIKMRIAVAALLKPSR